MTYYKDTLQAFLDNHIHEILGKLGREFDSNDFITAFRLLFPNEYATALRRSSSYRAIHTWIARWYLSAEPIYSRKAIFSREKASIGIQQKITHGLNFNTSTIWAENS